MARDKKARAGPCASCCSSARARRRALRRRRRRSARRDRAERSRKETAPARRRSCRMRCSVSCSDRCRADVRRARVDERDRRDSAAVVSPLTRDRRRRRRHRRRRDAAPAELARRCRARAADDDERERLARAGAAGHRGGLTSARRAWRRRVCRPRSSATCGRLAAGRIAIAYVSGSKQVPLVVAVKLPPFVVTTVTLTSVTASGNVDVTLVGRRAAVDVVVGGEAGRALAA